MVDVAIREGYDDFGSFVRVGSDVDVVEFE